MFGAKDNGKNDYTVIAEGVKIEGKKSVDAAFFDRICDDYGSI